MKGKFSITNPQETNSLRDYFKEDKIGIFSKMEQNLATFNVNNVCSPFKFSKSQIVLLRFVKVKLGNW